MDEIHASGARSRISKHPLFCTGGIGSGCALLETKDVDLTMFETAATTTATMIIIPGKMEVPLSQGFTNGVSFGVQVNLLVVVVSTIYHDWVTFDLVDASGNNLTAFAGNGRCHFEDLTLSFDDAGTAQREIVQHAKDSFVHAIRLQASSTMMVEAQRRPWTTTRYFKVRRGAYSTS
jgi:hypothetical protein